MKQITLIRLAVLVASRKGYSRCKYRRYLGIINVNCRFNEEKKIFVAFPWVETSTGPGGFMIYVFII